jgi:hypothetical protein
MGTVLQVDEGEEGWVIFCDDFKDIAPSCCVVGIGPVKGQDNSVVEIRCEGSVDSIAFVVRSPWYPDTQLLWCHVPPLVWVLAENNAAR